VSRNGYLLSCRGRTLPANASGFDTHRDSISRRVLMHGSFRALRRLVVALRAHRYAGCFGGWTLLVSAAASSWPPF
jgi:hypothetical protein